MSPSWDKSVFPCFPMVRKIATTDELSTGQRSIICIWLALIDCDHSVGGPAFAFGRDDHRASDARQLAPSYHATH